jgi:hypothetical protein
MRYNIPRRPLTLSAALAVLLGSIIGCGWGTGDDESEESEVSLPLASIATPAEPVVQTTQVPAPAPPPVPAPLRIGDAFPLLRTVTQTLTQDTPSGPKTARSVMQALLTLRIEEIQPDGRRRISVRYDRVRCTGEFEGQSYDFDSGLPPRAPLPPDVEPYRGLAENGFSFWMAPNGTVLELVGFSDFLRRCVREVPPDRHELVLERLAGSGTREAIATLIDDGIGLLDASPDNALLAPAAQSLYHRQLERPLGIRLDATCTVAALNDRLAEIDLAGTITPTPGAPPATQPEPVAVLARGGRTVGHVTLDRRTSLPSQYSPEITE